MAIIKMCSLPPEICADTIGWLAFMASAGAGVLLVPYVAAMALLPFAVVVDLFRKLSRRWQSALSWGNLK